MTEHHHKNKRTFFIGKRLGRLVSGGKSSSNQAPPAATTNTPTSNNNTPAKSKKKMRLRSSLSKRNINNNNATNTIDDDIEPNARASQKHQLRLQQQLANKQSSVAAAVANATTASSKLTSTTKQSPPTTLKDAAAASTANITSASGRLQEIEEMIAKGKEEMGLLQAAECFKIQAVVRGFLQRKKLKEATSSLKPSNSKKAANSTTPKRKKKRVKKTSNVSASDMADHKTRKIAAATKIQALVRGGLQRQRTKKLALKVHHSKHKKDKPEKKIFTSVVRDHYAWDQTEDGPEGDHYAWNEGDPTTTVSKGKVKDAPVIHKRGGKLSKSAHSKRRSLPHKDSQTSAMNKNGFNKQKAKIRRSASLNDNGNGNGSGVNEYSWKNHSTSMRDQSMRTQSTNERSMKDQSMPDHSIPFHELVVMGHTKDSSGSIASNSVMAVTAEVDDVLFEDSDDSDKEESLTSASRRSSHRSSIASSFVSKLTDHDESTFDGSLTSKEQDDVYSDALSQLPDQEDSEEPDLLDLSVMATAPLKRTPSELTEKDLQYFGGPAMDDKQRRKREQQQLQQQDHDDLSVSVMALSSTRSEGESDAEESHSDDDSQGSYAYESRYPQSGKRRTQEDDFSVSVMAVAEVSDLEADSGFEFDEDETDYEEDDYDEEDSDDDDDDVDDDTVMAVALEGDVDFDDENDNASVTFNAREDDMSITTCETDLPKENWRRHDRRRRRRHEVDVEDDEVIEAEDVSVLTTASNKRHKKHHDSQRQRAKRVSRKAQPKRKSYRNSFLLPQFSSDSSEEESYLARKRRQRRSRRSMKSKKTLDQEISNPDDEEELIRKLAEVNQYIEESRKEMEELMERECIKIQAFVRMHQERKMMESSGRSCTSMRHALSRTGTKEINNAAATIQALMRGCQVRTALERQIKSRTHARSNRNKQQSTRELEQKAAAEKARLKERLEEVEEKMKQCKGALEMQKTTQLQALVRGFLVRCKDLRKPEKIAVIKIQRLVRAALRVVQLRKKLATIAEKRSKQVQEIQGDKKKTIAEFEPGKFDDMDTRVKMVNFLKKQIEKENETTEKWVTKVKNVKENNVRLMTANSTSVCTVARLEIDVETREEKRDALLKLNQNWIDGIKEYEQRVEMVIQNTDAQKWQKEVSEKYCHRIVDMMEARCKQQKLVKEVKFCADHRGVVGGLE